MDTIVEKHRSHLPHIQLEGQIISLTWRLAFTLPKNILDLQEALKKDLEETDRNEASRLSNRYASYIKKLEELDTFLGKCEVDGLSLCADENARILISAINFHDKKCMTFTAIASCQTMSIFWLSHCRVKTGPTIKSAR